MKEAPVVTLNKNINSESKVITTFINGKDGDLYQIDFSKKENFIEINCNNTASETNDSYSEKLTLETIKKFIPVNNLNEFFKELNKINDDNCIIEKKDEHISLYLSLGKNNNQIKIKLYDFEKLKESSKKNQSIKEENTNLKKKLDLMEKKLNELNNQFEQYKTMMYLNYLYNSIDLNAYKLENIFNSLKSNIILKREEFILINKGIKKLLNKSIGEFNYKFTFKNDVFNSLEFKNIFSKLIYSVIVVVTKDNKRFGTFINKTGSLLNYNFNINERNNLLLNFNNNYNLGNKKQINLKDNNSINIFNSNSSYNEYFVFSLDSLKIDYSSKNKLSNFSIIYDKNRQCLYGNEITKESNLYFYQLSGKQEFNIQSFELYEIKLENEINF